MRRLNVGLAVGTVMVLGLAACGGSGTSDGAADGGGDSSAVVTEAKANVERNYAGTDRTLPTAAPEPPADKSVWVIVCSTSAEGCAEPGKGVVEASEALGWSAKLVDGKLDPGTFNSSIRSAVAAKADAIVLVSVDCALTKASIEAAQEQGVLVGGLYALDCDDEYAGGGDPLFDFELTYGDGQGYGDFLGGEYSASIADYAIAKTDGKAKVVAVRQNDVASVRHVGDGFVDRMKDCSTCEVTSVEITNADLLGGKIQGKVQTALTQNPDADVVFAPYDASISLGVAAGVKASGRDGQILLVGGEGLTPNIEMIASGSGQDFAAGAPARWAGWAATDELIRAFAGEPMVDEGIGVLSIDADHNLPTKTSFYDGNPASDYESNFRSIWGLGE